MAGPERDTYKYRFLSAEGEELCIGIAIDLSRRLREHQLVYGEPGGTIEQVGRRTTRSAALKWEKGGGLPISTKLREWDLTAREEVSAIGGELLRSLAFQRLEWITFLGALSPRYWRWKGSPFRRRRVRSFEGTRADHSVGVAYLLLLVLRELQLSERTQRCGVAWALLHDIATWPLSHTSEPVFSRRTGMSGRELRLALIKGDRHVPAKFHLMRTLEASGLAIADVLALFSNTAPEDPDLRLIWNIVRSPLTPDTLEGIWRTGCVFHMEVPHPREVADAFARGLLSPVVLRREFSNLALRFWRRKRDVYESAINRRTVVFWESRWIEAIRRAVPRSTVGGSLSITEPDLLDVVLRTGLPDDAPITKYKPPLEYYVHPPRRRVLSDDQPLAELAENLGKRRLENVGRTGEASQRTRPYHATSRE